MMSAETHEYVHELLEEDLSLLVIEEESASDLQAMLNELDRHGYIEVVALSIAGTPRRAASIPVQKAAWRYVAVLRKTESTGKE